MVVRDPHSILAWQPESTTALEYFTSIAWCKKILDDPSVRQYQCNYINRATHAWDPVIGGILSAQGGGGVFHYLTMLVSKDAQAVGNSITKSTLEAAPSVYSTEESGILTETSTTSSSPAPPKPKTRHDTVLRQSSALCADADRFPQHIDLYSLGPALTGLPNILHGGVIALVIDSAFGKLGMMHADLTGQFYSAYTNIRFRKPLLLQVATEKSRIASKNVTVMVKSQVDGRLTKAGSKKIYVVASVEGPDGIVYATGEGLLIEKTVKAEL